MKRESNGVKVRNYSEIQDITEMDLGGRTLITNRRNKVIKPRRFHLTAEKVEKFKKRFSASVSHLPRNIRKEGGLVFFNPYRVSGAYYGAVQALYELGCNEYHKYIDVKQKMQSIMEVIYAKKAGKTAWDKFSGKAVRVFTGNNRDLTGRIRHNFRTLQRLGGLNCYGKKLADLGACIDIYRDAKGFWFYNLNTKFDGKRKPIFDVSQYNDAVEARIKRNSLSSPSEEKTLVIESLE